MCPKVTAKAKSSAPHKKRSVADPPDGAAAAQAPPKPKKAGARTKAAPAPRARKKAATADSGRAAPDGSPQAIDGGGALALRRTSSADRIRHLIVLDAQGVVRRLSAQLGAMIELFSRHRDRDPLLAPLRSWIPSATFAQLAELEPDEQRALGQFLEELEALRWYCRYTDDMPNTAQARLARFAGQLESAARALIDTIHLP